MNGGLVRKLYRKLLTLYPRTFQELLRAPMEQTFLDLWNEKQQTRTGLLGFVIWTFFETALGIGREYLLLISPGDSMQTTLRTISLSGLVSFLPILPLTIMEVVNRRNFNEEFPFVLFFAMWLNLFAISLILLPIVRSRRTGILDRADAIPAQDNTLFNNPKWAAIISIVLILSPGILPLLNSIGWLSLDRLFNGPNPEVAYLPGQILNILLISLPIAAGIVAGRPIVHTRRAGGSLFAHPINLVIVIFISTVFTIGFSNFIIDQWPCFMGVPNCD
jgi:hypothetical protein